MAKTETRMTLGEHLDELRRRLMRAVIGVCVGMIACFFLSDYLFMALLWPLSVATAGHAPTLSYLALQEGFAVYFRVCLFAGAILAAPYVLYQLWQFVAAGLYEHERRIVGRILVPSVLLFFVGTGFYMVIVAPTVVRFFLAFGETSFPAAPTWGVDFFSKWLLPGGPVDIATQPARASVQAQLRLTDYIEFTVMMGLVFGLAFQTPLVVIILAKIGIVPVATFRRIRRYVLLAIVVAAAVISPSTDALGMIALAIPMYALYEIGLLFAREKKA